VRSSNRESFILLAMLAVQSLVDRAEEVDVLHYQVEAGNAATKIFVIPTGTVRLATKPAPPANTEEDSILVLDYHS